MTRFATRTLAFALIWTAAAAGQSSFQGVVDEVNGKMVKVFGAGGFRGIAAYGTGLVVSPDGHVLTGATQTLSTSNLRVHLPDGRRLPAKVLFVEKALDAALIKIQFDEDDDPDLAHFDFAAAAAGKSAGPGTWVLGFSNQFEIAMRDEPMTVQRGVIAARTTLVGRRGVFAAPYRGPVYVLDAITNNPGAAGGALTTRDGKLIGVIGKELRNTLTDTWVNYAVPVDAAVEVTEKGAKRTVTYKEFVAKGVAGDYRPTKQDEESFVGPGGYHGIVFVPNLLERTPPYIERVKANSPAAKAGLRPDDLIVFIDGELIVSIKDFEKVLKKTRPGMKLKLEVRRGSGLQSVDLTLGKAPKK